MTIELPLRARAPTWHLSEREGAHRVQASTDVENTGMRRALDALGFVDEGTPRSFMPMAEGPPRDVGMHGTAVNDWTRSP